MYTMQITSHTICESSKGSLYKQKPPLVGEYAFPLMEFVGWMTRATFSGKRWDNINCQTRVALPMYFLGQVEGQDFSEGKVF